MAKKNQIRISQEAIKIEDGARYQQHFSICAAEASIINSILIKALGPNSQLQHQGKKKKRAAFAHQTPIFL